MPFFTELKRRNVFKVGGAYTIFSWLLLQVLAVILPAFEGPDWVMRVVILFLSIGFFVSLFLAWAFELTPDGVKPTPVIFASSKAQKPSRQLLSYLMIAGFAATIMFFVVDRLFTADSNTLTPGQDLLSIAALPFANESAEEENAEFFANGMHDELLTYLAKISQLKVISRTSVMEYRDTTKNMRQIGEELGVATILEGRVQRLGDNVRINVQLINAETDEHLWAEIYDRRLTAENIFSIQSEMATSIANALQATLSAGEISQIDAIPTQSTAAYDFYLSGLDYTFRGEHELAAQQFQRAVDNDPEFSLAWAALARRHATIYWFSSQVLEENKRLSLEAVEHALALDPGLPEAHLALGQYYYHGLRDFEPALAELAIAEAGMPGQIAPLELQALIYRRLGEWQKAAQIARSVVDLDPRAVAFMTDVSTLFMRLDEMEQADSLLDRALEILPNYQIAYLRKSFIAIAHDGDSANSRLTLEQAPQKMGLEEAFWLTAIYERDYRLAESDLDGWQPGLATPGLSQIIKALYVAWTYSLSGQVEEARKQFSELQPQLEILVKTYPDDDYLVWLFGSVQAGLGEYDAAVRLGQQAMAIKPVSQDVLDGREVQLNVIRTIYLPAGAFDLAIAELTDYLAAPGMWWSIEGLLPDPRFDPIRDDPRFLALVEEYRR